MPEFPIPASFGVMEDWRAKYNEEALIEEFSQKRYDALAEHLKIFESTTVEKGSPAAYEIQQSDQRLQWI